MIWVAEHDGSQWKPYRGHRKGRGDRLAHYRSDRMRLRLWEIKIFHASLYRCTLMLYQILWVRIVVLRDRGGRQSTTDMHEDLYAAA